MKNSEPVNRQCPKVKTDSALYAETTSFPDWCNGIEFKDAESLTEYSAFLRIMTFNTTRPNSLNKKIYFDLFDQYEKSGFKRLVNYATFVDIQLTRFNSTANKILNQACDIYRGPNRNNYAVEIKLIEDKAKVDQDESFSGLCPPKTMIAAYYCFLLEYPFPTFTKYLFNGLTGVQIYNTD